MKASIPGTVRRMQTPSDDSPRRFRGRMAALLVLVIVSTVAVTGLLWVRSHGFSARATPGAFETAVARAVRSLAVPPAVRDLANPLQPTELRLARARDHFADHCATCHANDGSGKTMVNEGLYPPAHDLRSDDVQRMTDGELFHVIREGVRFTGMPGWGGDEETNWELVLFVRHLPGLTAVEEAMMREVNGERY